MNENTRNTLNMYGWNVMKRKNTTQLNTNWPMRRVKRSPKAGDGAKALAGLRKLEHLLKIKGATSDQR